MAGSYHHVHDHGFSLIENMRDAYQCVEELYYLVRALAADDKEVEYALDQFYKFKRGEAVPTTTSTWATDRAYLETQEKMSK